MNSLADNAKMFSKSNDNLQLTLDNIQPVFIKAIINKVEMLFAISNKQ